MKAIVLSLALIAAPAFALQGFLQSEEVNGNLKYCKYSNGRILTVSSLSFCPMSA